MYYLIAFLCILCTFPKASILQNLQEQLFNELELDNGYLEPLARKEHEIQARVKQTHKIPNNLHHGNLRPKKRIHANHPKESKPLHECIHDEIHHNFGLVLSSLLPCARAVVYARSGSE